MNLTGQPVKNLRGFENLGGFMSPKAAADGCCQAAFRVTER
ncbi:Uncharacterized protein dnm_002380 [Desulfonema magnum]|uniref:Uncharacterized protein n=1 Tax=Desulfonema magnum TaxID=45655 RepID=A0A975BEI2_9BACT|nr:Uncharacterized protein dnm_002380 [Desulfonema magnum]